MQQTICTGSRPERVEEMGDLLWQKYRQNDLCAGLLANNAGQALLPRSDSPGTHSHIVLSSRCGERLTPGLLFDLDCSAHKADLLFPCDCVHLYPFMNTRLNNPLVRLRKHLKHT